MYNKILMITYFDHMNAYILYKLDDDKNQDNILEMFFKLLPIYIQIKECKRNVQCACMSNNLLENASIYIYRK